MDVDFNTKEKFHWWILEEVDILSNYLMALSKFKQRCGEYFPTRFDVNRDSYRYLQEFEDITVYSGTVWTIRGALYTWLYQPLYDPHEGIRTAVVYEGKREPIKDDRRRKRSDLK